jgi:hypothetical protein
MVHMRSKVGISAVTHNHALHLKPRAEMMQAWADHLEALHRC